MQNGVTSPECAGKGTGNELNSDWCNSMPFFQKFSRNNFPSVLGPVHMIPGQLSVPGQLTDPGVNFDSVHGLTPVTVHMSFSLPRGNFESSGYPLYNTG